MARPGRKGSHLVRLRLVHPAGRLAHRALELGGEAVAHAAGRAGRVGRAGAHVAQVGATDPGAARELGEGAGLGDQPAEVPEADVVDVASHGRVPLAQR